MHEPMDASRLLFLVSMVTSSAELKGAVDPTCPHFDPESFLLLEGEGFYFVPLVFNIIRRPPDEQFTWYRNTSRVEKVSSDVDDRVHHQGAALFLLDLRPEDSGLYTAQQIDPSGSCRKFLLNVTVFKTSHKNNSELFYGTIRNSDDNKVIECPDPVRKTCDEFRGGVAWYRNFTLIPGEQQSLLRVQKATKQDEGIYTCVCTWTHRNKRQKSSGSYWLKVKHKSIHSINIIFPPNNYTQEAAEGAELRLNCSVSSGVNTEKTSSASWSINGKPADGADGYNQTTTVVSVSGKTTWTAVLSITRVSAQHFLAEFQCHGRGFYDERSTTLRLKRKESILPLVAGGLCVVGSFVVVVVLLKCFSVDVTLVYRRFLPVSIYKLDSRTYDAYVVYQTQGLDKASEDRVYRFVTNVLPSVLEEQCGYRLFIHGRDDLPGEDLMELVEERMKQSRRLMIVLTLGVEPGTPASLQGSVVGGFDWQVGFHHALIQTDMKAILIQLGDSGSHGYADLPPSLQHLIRRSPPIRWPEASRAAAAAPNSRFWKRVRYLMPAVPAQSSMA